MIFIFSLIQVPEIELYTNLLGLDGIWILVSSIIFRLLYVLEAHSDVTGSVLDSW